MILNKNLITSLLLVFSFVTLMANPFEGVIYFKKTDNENVTYFRYYVKDNLIRIEDVNEGGVLNGILLIDMEKGSLKMLSCSSQMYIDVPKSPECKSPKVKIDRTGEVKMINGRECELWKVENTEDRTHFEYWVHEGSYPFFTPMLKMLNRNDKIALAWNSLMIGDDFFPYVGIEYSSTSKVLTRIDLIEIHEKELDLKIFDIPQNYSLFERKINN